MACLLLLLPAISNPGAVVYILPCICSLSQTPLTRGQHHHIQHCITLGAWLYGLQLGDPRHSISNRKISSMVCCKHDAKTRTSTAQWVCKAVHFPHSISPNSSSNCYWDVKLIHNKLAICKWHSCMTNFALMKRKYGRMFLKVRLKRS